MQHSRPSEGYSSLFVDPLRACSAVEGTEAWPSRLVLMSGAVSRCNGRICARFEHCSSPVAVAFLGT